MQGKTDYQTFVILLKKYKMPELKELAKASGLDHKNKKQDLIELIANKWVEKEAERVKNINSTENYTPTTEIISNSLHSHTKVPISSKCDDKLNKMSVIGELLQTLAYLPTKIRTPVQPLKA